MRLFAVLRDAAGTAALTLELPGGATAATAAAELCARLPAAAAAHVARAAFAVNQEYVRPDAPLRDGDELAVIPPVSGG